MMKNWTREYLANEAGVTEGTIRNFENNYNSIGLNKLNDILGALDLEIEIMDIFPDASSQID